MTCPSLRVRRRCLCPPCPASHSALTGNATRHAPPLQCPQHRQALRVGRSSFGFSASATSPRTLLFSVPLLRPLLTFLWFLFIFVHKIQPGHEWSVVCINCAGVGSFTYWLRPQLSRDDLRGGERNSNPRAGYMLLGLRRTTNTHVYRYVGSFINAKRPRARARARTHTHTERKRMIIIKI